MDVLNGEVIFFLITIGLILGAITKLIMRKTKINLIQNLGMGILGSLMIGIPMMMLKLSGALLFTAIGTMAVLFILNVFNQQSEANY